MSERHGPDPESLCESCRAKANSLRAVEVDDDGTPQYDDDGTPSRFEWTEWGMVHAADGAWVEIEHLAKLEQENERLEQALDTLLDIAEQNALEVEP